LGAVKLFNFALFFYCNLLIYTLSLYKSSTFDIVVRKSAIHFLFVVIYFKICSLIWDKPSFNILFWYLMLYFSECDTILQIKIWAKTVVQSIRQIQNNIKIYTAGCRLHILSSIWLSYPTWLSSLLNYISVRHWDMDCSWIFHICCNIYVNIYSSSF